MHFALLAACHLQSPICLLRGCADLHTLQLWAARPQCGGVCQRAAADATTLAAHPAECAASTGCDGFPAPPAACHTKPPVHSALLHAVQFPRCGHHAQVRHAHSAPVAIGLAHKQATCLLGFLCLMSGACFWLDLSLAMPMRTPAVQVQEQVHDRGHVQATKAPCAQ